MFHDSLCERLRMLFVSLRSIRDGGRLSRQRESYTASGNRPMKRVSRPPSGADKRSHLRRILSCGRAHLSNSDLTSILFVLLILVALAQLLGYLFVKLRQPKVLGEILAGIVLGPALLGRLPFASGLMEATKRQGSILTFVYWLGLLLLMFLSGAETRQLFSRDERVRSDG